MTKCLNKRSHILAVVLATFMLLTGSSIASALTITLQPGPDDGKDTGVWSRSGFQTTNTGGNERIYNQYNSDSWNGYGYFQFDLSSTLSSTDIVTKAEVTFHNWYISYLDAYWNAGPESYVVESVGSAWDEMTLTWANQPGTDNAYKSSVVEVNPNALTWETYSSTHFYTIGTATIDITELVVDWHTGAKDNYGFIYRMAGPKGHGGEDGNVYTSDSAIESYRPMLEISYEPVPEPGTMLLFGSGLIGLAGFSRRLGKKEH